VPPPRRGFWRPKTILGEVKTGHGMLRNRLYVGKLVYGRTRAVVNPLNRRRLMKPSLTAAIEQDVPQLRIIDDALWTSVQDRFAAAEASAFRARDLWPVRRRLDEGDRRSLGLQPLPQWRAGL
jgi:hypothetical protein